MTFAFRRSLPLAVALALACAGAHAQYVWLNEKGGKQFSDMPPPPDVPKNRILKSPDMMSAAPAATEDSNTQASQEPNHPTLADQEADYRKRKAEQAEKAKKADAEAKRKALNAADCQRARAYSQTLDSGQRISTTDDNGERAYLTDEQRAKERRDVASFLKDCQ